MVEMIVYGALGAAILLIAYLLELFGHIDYENRGFLLANIIGSALLFYYSYLLGSIVFMVLNAVWALGSLYEIWRVSK